MFFMEMFHVELFRIMVKNEQSFVKFLSVLCSLCWKMPFHDRGVKELFCFSKD